MSLAEHIGGDLNDPDDGGGLRIARVRPPELAGPQDAAVILDGDEGLAEASRAGLLIVGRGVRVIGRPALFVDDPRRALVDLLDLVHPVVDAEPAVHPDATVSPQARVDPSVSIGPGARIEAGVRLETGVEIHANSVIGADSVIGERTVVHPNVTIYPGTLVGSGVEIQSGTVIGASGFGLLREPGGSYRPIPQIGAVVIEDDVTIGANCAIDRATLDVTLVGRGTKIDNLVQIGHNTRIGEDCCVVAQVGIAGSVRIGDRCVLLAQSGVKDHVVVEDDVYLGAQAGAAGNLRSGEWLGTPALPAVLGRRVLVALRRLPELLREVRSLRREIDSARDPEADRSAVRPAEPGDPGRE